MANLLTVNQKADKILNWGILSTAAIAEKAYVPGIRAACNGTIRAVASRSPDKARAFAEKHGIPVSYGSYEELLTDEEIDVIYNPLPVALHAEWTLKALEAGKPVLCEKPFALSASEARAMEKKSQETKLLVAEAVMYRYHPLTQKVRELVTAGAIGELKVIESNFHGVQDTGNNIRFNKELGGGAMLDLGIYCVNLARFLTGEEPSTIHATGFVNPENGVDESVAGVLGFPSGVVSSFACSMRTQFSCSYRLTGTAGSISVPQGGMLVWPDQSFPICLNNEEGEKTIEIDPANHYQLMAEDFAASVLEGRSPAYPVDDAIANMAVIDEILKQVQKQ